MRNMAGVNGMEKRDFFISYTKTDKAWAVWIADVLKKNGYSVYVQALDIRPGDNFIEKMNEFLKNSDNFLAIWSKAYSQSRFCMTEFEAAFNEWHKKRINYFLSACIDTHPMEPLYAALVHVDLPDMGAASESDLMNAVRYVVPRPDIVPDEPKDIATDTFHMDTDIPLSDEDADTLYQRGDSYHHGKHGVKQDYIKARKCYEQAAEKGHIDALNALGELYNEGDGVEVNYDKARDYFEQAAAKGNSNALNNLGWLYEYGYSVEQDYAKALDYYEQAAAKGNVYALYNLGLSYENGNGVKKDYPKARGYFEQAAAKGDIDALEHLGGFYFYAVGVEQNYAKARQYYEQAAVKGHVGALCTLGFLFENGYGVKKDYIRARRYYEQSAAKGDINALWNLAVLYENGRGVKRSYSKALAYYQKAADMGDWDAHAKIAQLRKKLRR